MIEVAEIMSHFEELTGSDSYFYVDDSVVFAKILTQTYLEN